MSAAVATKVGFATPNVKIHDSPEIGRLIVPLSSTSTVVSIVAYIEPPFNAIRRLFDHLQAHPEDANTLNATYPKRGVYKTAATHNATSDQKFTIDLSPSRIGLIGTSLRSSLSSYGLDDILEFFCTVEKTYVNAVLSALDILAGADMSATHTSRNINFRLCDYSPDTAAPACYNGCGAHTDYGTFSIIFQDGTPGLELEDADKPNHWIQVDGNATVILTGWCAVILSGGRIRATRHRVRRIPGVRRLSAVLFVAPDLEAKLLPMDGIEPEKAFSTRVMEGEIDVERFKEIMGKKWRHREGNENLSCEEDATQDSEVEKLIWV